MGALTVPATTAMPVAKVVCSAMDLIDLRSDTVTSPSPGMRQAMAAAPVGDDQYGEDPSVNRLQERIAEMLGKQAALFVPSGTMANQIGLKILTRPGDDVVVGEEAHIVWHESGAAAANSGVQFTVVGRGGLFTAADLREAASPLISTARGCSMPQLPPDTASPSSRRRSTLFRWRCRKGSAAQWEA